MQGREAFMGTLLLLWKTSNNFPVTHPFNYTKNKEELFKQGFTLKMELQQVQPAKMEIWHDLSIKRMDLTTDFSIWWWMELR